MELEIRGALQVLYSVLSIAELRARLRGQDTSVPEKSWQFSVRDLFEDGSLLHLYILSMEKVRCTVVVAVRYFWKDMHSSRDVSKSVTNGTAVSVAILLCRPQHAMS